MFIPDPSVTVVIVDIRVAAGANDLAAWPKKYLLFVPNETLLAHCEDDAYNSTMFSFGHAYPEGTAELRRPVGLGRSKEVPWEEWGPRGTRMIEAEASTTVLGSKAAIVRWIYCRREYAVTVYEALPLADLDPSSDQPVVHSGSSSERPSRETVIPASVYWKEPVRTTYPLRETKFTFDPEEGMAVRGSKVVLTCDGLAFIAVSVCVSQCD